MICACGADDDVGALLRRKFRKLRFQMIDDTYAGKMRVMALAWLSAERPVMASSAKSSS